MTLPGGKVLKVETMLTPEDHTRGLMFRTSLASDRGMLFVYDKPARYPYGMFQTRIPLDILWLDSDHRIVEMVKNAQPCPGATRTECPVFVGKHVALTVLELVRLVESQKYNLRAGQTVEWVREWGLHMSSQASAGRAKPLEVWTEEGFFCAREVHFLKSLLLSGCGRRKAENRSDF